MAETKQKMSTIRVDQKSLGFINEIRAMKTVKFNSVNYRNDLVVKDMVAIFKSDPDLMNLLISRNPFAAEE